MFEEVNFESLFKIPQRNGLTKPSRIRGEGVKMVNMGELFSHRRIHKLPMDRVPCTDKELSQNKLEDGDLLFARQSLTLEGAGKCSIFLGDEEQVVFESHLIRCRLDSAKSDPGYYFYLFESKFGKDRIGSIVEQVAAAGIRGSDLAKLRVLYPPISDQKAIAHILGTLDDKIELNQKMNQTLEDIAKAVFKSWFVDFDPVRAKAEGRPTGLPAEISDLFPDAFEDSEIGEIPAGWKTSAVSGFADLNTKSINPSNSDEVFEHFSIPAFDNGRTPVADAGKNIKSNKTLMPAECLLVSKLNPDTPRIWYPNKAQGRRQICSTEFLAFTPRSSGKSPFLWGLFTSTPVSERMTAMVTGTSKSHQRVKPRDVLDITVTATPPALVEAFCKVVSPMLERILLGKEETKTLSELRDTLLPKLISGELRIPDAEKFLEAAGI